MDSSVDNRQLQSRKCKEIGRLTRPSDEWIDGLWIETASWRYSESLFYVSEPKMQIPLFL